ncbi:ABC transporter substrate-binding protein [Altererythrobacter indicus]|uniref:ABC transporter substrate-binding protein n=1 Tax=Altericroceibacterium indicum TaxID=374177 RepID=A0A845AD55_9SPHN|nr:siderophore ABC transporter substrate-binding protein [Altericroceibacterium indicum]MXP26921.1 ABC transporter substrate-binding protein [Altericroceibacterium indicum]
MMLKLKSATSACALLACAVMLQGCDRSGNDAREDAQEQAEGDFAPVTVKHKLGTTVVSSPPQRVAALDMNEVDFLDQLGVPIAGMPKDFIPGFLAKYRDDDTIADLGSIVQPNTEKVYGLRPDLVLISSLHANQYEALSQIAPTISFDVDYQDTGSDYFDTAKDHLLTLGRIFGREELARRKADQLEAIIVEARDTIADRPEKALILMHNAGAYRFMGVNSRYGFVHEALGVSPASDEDAESLHGLPVSSEFIQQADPDIIYLIDRTAVMEHRAGMSAATMDNPLIRATKAWKNKRVIFVDPEAWYVTGAGPTSIGIVIDDVLKGYADSRGAAD